MVTCKALIAYSIFAVSFLSPQILSAQGITGEDVLKWPEESQNALFLNSATMAGIIAGQTGDHDNIALCIDRWLAGAGDLPSFPDRVREVLTGLPGYHPQAIVLAVIEKECGDF